MRLLQYSFIIIVGYMNMSGRVYKTQYNNCRMTKSDNVYIVPCLQTPYPHDDFAVHEMATVIYDSTGRFSRRSSQLSVPQASIAVLLLLIGWVCICTPSHSQVSSSGWWKHYVSAMEQMAEDPCIPSQRPWHWCRRYRLQWTWVLLPCILQLEQD